MAAQENGFYTTIETRPRQARNPRGFEALLDEALTEDDDYRALARGCEDVWSAALRPQLAAVEPAVAAKIRDLLARWAASS